MAIAGYSATIAVSGAAVSVTGEACSLVTTGKYQVTNAARRIIDPSAAVVVKDGGTPVSASLWTYDYLFGIVTFSGYSVTGAVTVDASYLPTYSVAECKGVDIKASGDLSDTSVFGSAFKKRTATLADCSISIERLVLPLDDIDTVTAGTQSIDGWLKAGTPRLLDINFTTGGRFRAWVLFGDYFIKAQTSGVVEVSVSASGAAQLGGAGFSWGT